MKIINPFTLVRSGLFNVVLFLANMINIPLRKLGEGVWFQMVRNERLILHYSQSGRSLDVSLNIFSTKNDALALKVVIGDDFEDTFVFCVAIPWLVRFRFSMDGPVTRLHRWIQRDGYHGREFGFRLTLEHCGFYWWHDQGGFSTHRGWDYSFVPEDVLKGRHEYISEEDSRKVIVGTVPAHDEYPETEVTLTVIKYNVTLRYSRWFNVTGYRYHVISEEPVLTPGKGTMDYNCGDNNSNIDISFAMNDKNSFEDAALAAVEDQYQVRLKYPL